VVDACLWKGRKMPGESDILLLDGVEFHLIKPYAIEHDGKLYVGYSNSGGEAGRVGEGRQLWNNNSAELAVIPIKPCLTRGD